MAWVRGGAAGLLVAMAGGFDTIVVWILALIAFLSFRDLGQRETTELDGSGTEDWTGWLLQGAFLVILAAAAWDNRSSPTSSVYPLVAEAFGLALIGGALLLRRRTREAMGRHFTVRIQSSPGHELVQTGPFRVLRHPSYASLGLLALGTALSTRSLHALLATALVWVPAVAIRIAREESFLARRFGAAYESYAQRTWRLVPGVF
jgi:protein-S-isoprenylcysteine O-methyltransferase